MSVVVLLVDDVEATRYVQATRLRRAGFEVIEAASGAEAFLRLTPEVDVVVLDVNLPDLSGFEVCARIKADPETAGVPVMHLSATAIDVTSRAHGLDRGADAYLVEPVDPAELIATVRTLSRSRAAHRMGERLTRLVAATLPLSWADTVPSLLEAAAGGVADVLDAPALAVAESESGVAVRALCGGRGVKPMTASGAEPALRLWHGRPQYLDSTQLPPVWTRMLARAGVRAERWFLHPVPDPLRSAGGLAVALPPGRQTLPEDEARIVGQLVDSVAAALGKLRAYTQEHQTALVLQRALLPDVLPSVPGLSFAARYIASTEEVMVGGDFYDVFALPGQRVALVIGDVQGHSLRAANVMAELRFSLRAYLFENHPPARALALLSNLLQTQHPGLTASLAVLLLDRRDWTVSVTNAGHPPPLLVADGTAGYLEEHGVLLGAARDAPGTTTVALPPGALLVLITDGLIERRGESLDVGLATLLQTVIGVEDSQPEAVAEELIHRFTRHGVEDDVAVLVARRAD